MDAITSYVNHLLSGLPQTAEVNRARRELIQMSSDRFEQLRADGVPEQEAVGRVIAQFGDLDELADDLGIRAEITEVTEGAPAWAAAAAGEHLSLNRRAANLFGAFLLAVAAIPLPFVAWRQAESTYHSTGAIGDYPSSLPYQGVMVAIGVVAVGLLGAAITTTVQSSRAARDLRALDSVTLSDYQVIRERERGPQIAAIVIGVVLALVAAWNGPLMLFGMDMTGGPILFTLAALAGPFVFAIGLALVIRALMRRNALARIVAERHRLEGAAPPVPRRMILTDHNPRGFWGSPINGR